MRLQREKDLQFSELLQHLQTKLPELPEAW